MHMRLLAYLGVQHVCGLMLLTRTKADVFRVKECNTNNNNLIYIHIYIYTINQRRCCSDQSPSSTSVWLSACQPSPRLQVLTSLARKGTRAHCACKHNLLYRHGRSWATLGHFGQTPGRISEPVVLIIEEERLLGRPHQIFYLWRTD